MFPKISGTVTWNRETNWPIRSLSNKDGDGYGYGYENVT